MNPETWQQLKSVFHAALDLPPEQRAAFLTEICAGNDPLRQRIDGLLASHEEAGPFLRSPAMVDAGLASSAEHSLATEEEERAGQRIGPYQIIRELGHGGMGTVFLAVRADDEYRKQVAIKLINRGMDTDLILRRFIMERQILANLEHPNIARLLEGGSTQDGLPYFVMEYVEGRAITEYCDELRLTIAQRLELFREVCGALQYAHQNLVVHRDIKPSNILVTAEGVPKLLDFGIAKLLNPGWASETGEATASMVRLMTPEYASPEQFRGRSITTASDVYSLGLVLYELLSGQHPYRLSSRRPDEVAKVILEEEPEKPSDAISDFALRISELKAKGTSTSELLPDRQTNPQSAIRNPKFLRGDLDNIVLKALRKEPQRRYASVQELSEDIRRHLEGLPVIASPDTLSYRAGKFIRRHKVGVLAAAVVIIALCAATAVTTWQARVARRERIKAENRFNQVRKLAKSVLFDYHDGIENLPGSTPVRERMVKDALVYLDNLYADSAENSELQSELASAYQKVGDVQGSPFSANLGNYKGALASYKRALALREKLNSAAPGNSQIQLDLIRSYEAVGGMSQVTGDIPTALDNYRRAFAVFDSLKTESTQSKSERSILYRRLAKALAPSGKLPEALDNYRKSIALSNEIISLEPNNQTFKGDLASTYISLGDALTDSGDLKGALAEHRSAFALLEPSITSTSVQSRRLINVAYSRMARVMARMGDHRGSLEIELKSLAIDEELAKADPANALARRDVYIDYLKVARQQAAIGDLQAALVNQHKFISLCEAEIALNPDSSELRTDQAVGYQRFGELLEKHGDEREALKAYKKSLSVQETLSAADPANMLHRANLSEIQAIVCDTSVKVGERTGVLEGYLRAAAIREGVVAKNPGNPDSRAMLSLVYESLGAFYSKRAATENHSEDWREAKNRYRQSYEILNSLKEQDKLPHEYANKPNEVKQKLLKVEAALRK
ncbi:MAG: ppkA [Acidobacteria bacterium]|nr:ppkA [Acidobacteriota bacterium]